MIRIWIEFYVTIAVVTGLYFWLLAIIINRPTPTYPLSEKKRPVKFHTLLRKYFTKSEFKDWRDEVMDMELP